MAHPEQENLGSPRQYQRKSTQHSTVFLVLILYQAGWGKVKSE